jgi:DNA-binding HxlR family transcriptional regulator
MDIKIERLVMSGKGPKVMYKLVSEGKTLFVNKESPFGSFYAWTKKKDAQNILNAIKEKGLEYVEEKMGIKAF